MIPEELRKAKILHQIALRDHTYIIRLLFHMGALNGDKTQLKYLLDRLITDKEDWDSLTEDEKNYNLMKVKML